MSIGMQPAGPPPEGPRFKPATPVPSFKKAVGQRAVLDDLSCPPFVISHVVGVQTLSGSCRKHD